MLTFSLYLILLWLVLLALKPTRRLGVALTPWLLFAILYDGMRLYPNYEVNAIDIRGIYERERDLFGITTIDGRMILGEYFTLHHTPVADLLAGAFYLCWVPVPMGYALWLFATHQRSASARVAIAFLWINIIGFIIYYIHPAAPPWYVLNYGFDPILSTPGSVAGLGRCDALIGIPLFESIYAGNANIFAAVPSLHSAYVLLAAIYAALLRQRALAIAFFIITAGIWSAAVYTCHHYVIDVLLGIAVAIGGILLLEGVVYRLPPIRRAVDRFVRLMQ